MWLKVSFAALDEAIAKMGATEMGWSDDAKLDDFEIQLNKGIEIDINDVEIGKDGLLSYRGAQVLLYIKDTKKDREVLLHHPESGPKFHVADCCTLEQMRIKGRFERYVVTNNLTGRFLVFALVDWQTRKTEEVESELKVCRNCLSRLNYERYASGGKKGAIWKDFNIAEFFKTYESRFHSKPKYTDKNAPNPEYSKDWAEISSTYRSHIGWRCEAKGCGVNLFHHKHLLHVHHRNGVTGDNAWSNLQALCIVCHAEQPAHGHLKVNPVDRALIMKLRD